MKSYEIFYWIFYDMEEVGILSNALALQILMYFVQICQMKILFESAIMYNGRQSVLFVYINFTPNHQHNLLKTKQKLVTYP